MQWETPVTGRPFAGQLSQLPGEFRTAQRMTQKNHLAFLALARRRDNNITPALAAPKIASVAGSGTGADTNWKASIPIEGP